jgi:hypothetical protein
MKSRIKCLLIPVLVFGCSGIANSKTLKIENATETAIETVDVDLPDAVTKEKKTKRFALRIEAATGKDKDKIKKSKNLDTVTDLGVDENTTGCLADISFVLADGNTIEAPKTDLCQLDGIVVDQGLPQSQVLVPTVVQDVSE